MSANIVTNQKTIKSFIASDAERASGVALASRQASLESAIVGGLLQQRRRGMAIVDAAGITSACFDQPDCRFAFTVLDAWRDRDTFEVLRGIRFLLQRFHLWDDDVPARSTGMIHSDHSLAAWAHRETGELLECAVVQLRTIVDVVDAGREAAA